MSACSVVEVEQEDAGRSLAELVHLPGVMAQGETADAALLTPRPHRQADRAHAGRTAAFAR